MGRVRERRGSCLTALTQVLRAVRGYTKVSRVYHYRRGVVGTLWKISGANLGAITTIDTYASKAMSPVL